MSAVLDTDRLEQALCAQAVLGDERVLDRLQLRAEDFGLPAAATVYAAAGLVHEQGELPTPGAVEAQLRMDGLLNQSVRDLLDSVRRDEALTKLEEAALIEQVEMRRMARAAAEVSRATSNGDLRGARSAAAGLAAARDMTAQGGSSVSLKEAAVGATTAVFERDGSRERVTFGLAHLDQQLWALEPGTMCVVGADTGVGKSSTCLTMALGQAADGVASGIVSLEDSRHIWGARAAGKWARVSPLDMRRKLDPDKYSRLGQLIPTCPDPPVYLEDPIGGDEDQVCAAMRRLVHQRGAQVLYVDYVQAIRSGNTNAKRHDQVREIASRLKAQAYALDVPLVLVSQLRRRKADESKEPNKHDLKESGDLENAAEIILLLWLPDSEKRDFVAGKIEKSKWGCEYPKFSLVRGEGGMLREATPYD